MENNIWGFKVGKEYDRNEIAKMLGYKSFEAISRGVVTPKGSNTIILFVTKEKEDTAVQYKDNIIGDKLLWEGESSHNNDHRIIDAKSNDEILFLFYRKIHHLPFIFYGPISLNSYKVNIVSPSNFIFLINE